MLDGKGGWRSVQSGSSPGYVEQPAQLCSPGPFSSHASAKTGVVQAATSQIPNPGQHPLGPQRTMRVEPLFKERPEPVR